MPQSEATLSLGYSLGHMKAVDGHAQALCTILTLRSTSQPAVALPVQTPQDVRCEAHEDEQEEDQNY